MKEIAENLKSASKKKLFGRKPIFKKTGDFSVTDLQHLELSQPVPQELVDWLGLTGYGTINEELSFEQGWMQVLGNEFGPLSGGLTIAQDDLGNYLVLNPNDEWSVYYLCHDPFGIAKIDPSFTSFTSRLGAANFDFGKVIEHLDIDESAIDFDS